MKFLYLILNILTISYPLIRSFEPRIHYVAKWRSLFIGIFFTASFFIVWDILFTKQGIWGFNDAYITGLNIANLPIEEWLFFITVPFACLFIYEVMNYFVTKDILGKAAPFIAMGIVIVILPTGLYHMEKLYTSITFILTGVLLVMHAVLWKSKYLGRFFLGYFVSLFPFFIVNSILTGTLIRGQVVWYNDSMNLNIRLGTIPVEDSMYLLLLLLLTTTFYEALESRRTTAAKQSPKG